MSLVKAMLNIKRRQEGSRMKTSGRNIKKQKCRFCWTKSPPKSAQKSTLESRPAQKRPLESKSTFFSAQKSAQLNGFAQKSAQMRSFTQQM